MRKQHAAAYLAPAWTIGVRSSAGVARDIAPVMRSMREHFGKLSSPHRPPCRAQCSHFSCVAPAPVAQSAATSGVGLCSFLVLVCLCVVSVCVDGMCAQVDTAVRRKLCSSSSAAIARLRPFVIQALAWRRMGPACSANAGSLDVQAFVARSVRPCRSCLGAECACRCRRSASLNAAFALASLCAVACSRC